MIRDLVVAGAKALYVFGILYVSVYITAWLVFR